MNLYLTDKESSDTNRRTHRFDLLDFFMFASMTLVGSDIWNIDIGGYAFRFVFVSFAICLLLLMLKGRYKLAKQNTLFAFVCFFLVSAALSINITSSIVYVFYLLFSVLAILFVFYSYIMLRGTEFFFWMLRRTLCLQAVLLLLQFVLEALFQYQIPFFTSGTYMGIPRPALWFYETSYFATYFSFWLILSYYMFFLRRHKDFLSDCIFSTIAVVFATSTIGYVAIALSIVFTLMIAFQSGKIQLVIKVTGIFLITAMVFFFFFPDITELFIMRLFGEDLNAASGGRLENNVMTWEVFWQNPLFGTGPNTYGEYLGAERHTVPSNVTLELMATAGLFAAASFYVFVLRLMLGVFRASRLTSGRERDLMRASILGLLLFMVVLQSNQGYLRPYMWMFFGILLAQLQAVRGRVRGRKESFVGGAIVCAE